MAAEMATAVGMVAEMAVETMVVEMAVAIITVIQTGPKQGLFFALFIPTKLSNCIHHGQHILRRNI